MNIEHLCLTAKRSWAKMLLCLYKTKKSQLWVFRVCSLLLFCSCTYKADKYRLCRISLCHSCSSLLVACLEIYIWYIYKLIYLDSLIFILKAPRIVIKGRQISSGESWRLTEHLWAIHSLLWQSSVVFLGKSRAAAAVCWRWCRRPKPRTPNPKPQEPTSVRITKP